MPSAAAFLLDLGPGLGAAAGPEPGASLVLLPYYLLLETAALVRTEGMFDANPQRLWEVLLGLCTDGRPALTRASGQRAAGVSVAELAHSYFELRFVSLSSCSL